MWQRINFEPGGAVAPSSKILKAGRTCFISLAIAAAQKVVPVSLSISKAPFIFLGNSIPNLKSFFRCLNLMLETILSRFLRVNGTHQAKASSLSSLFVTAYSDTSNGLLSFKFRSVSHVVVTSFHLTLRYHPLVDFLLLISVWMSSNSLLCFMAVLSDL